MRRGRRELIGPDTFATHPTGAPRMLSDMNLKDDVLDELDFEPSVAAKGIGVLEVIDKMSA